MDVGRWCGARSICEYCLAASTSVEMRVTESVDLGHQLLGLEGVARASAAPPSSSSRRRRRGDLVQELGVDAGRDEHRGQLPAAADAVRRPASRVSSSSRVGRLHRGQLGRVGGRLDGLAPALDERSSSFGSSSCRAASIASLCRMPATRSRSAAVARDRGRGRVVQLVGQARRTARRARAAAPAGRRSAGVLVQPEEQALEQVHRPSGTRCGPRGRSPRPAARRTGSR